MPSNRTEELPPEKPESKVGMEWAPQVYEIEKGMLNKFLKAVRDSNPLWQNEKSAAGNKSDGVITPPTFTSVIGFEDFYNRMIASTPSASMKLLNGGTEFEFYEPIRVGDTITVTTKIIDSRVQEGKKGPMIIMTFQMIYQNQKQKMVAKMRQVAIWY